MLRVTFSNRCETLLDALLADMDSAPASPFDAEQVIVPGAAQRRVVTLALARHRGVCANVEFAFLAEWLWAQMGHFVQIAEASPFAAQALVWRIRELFDDERFVGSLSALRRYVADADPLLRYELAREIATLFETYVTYRPSWLARWSAGERVPELAGDPVARAHEPWQAALWARIAADIGVSNQHPSLAFFAEIERLGPDAARRQGLPERAYFFALPSVPPLYLAILRHLARWVDVHVYVLNPSREYWYEIVDRRRLTWLESTGAALHHEVGNALLAGWGKQTRDFIDLMLTEGGEEAIIDDEHFVASDDATMLAGLQNAILDLRELAPGSLAGLADDRSVEVHVCHSLSRQLEALRDQLLALFDGDDAPSPSEVLVLLPDLDGAAPLIEAVFGTSRARRIPYAITGRSSETDNPVADLLLRLLALPAARLAADEVFDLLQHPLVVRRLRLDDAALARIHDWMRVSGMRWGLDGRQRGGGDDAFSLRDGLRRLLLGHALPGRGGADGLALCAGVLPVGDAFGSEAADLGALWQFVGALEATLSEFARPRPAPSWPAVLLRVLADWSEGGTEPAAEDIDALQLVRAAIDGLATDFETAGANAPIGIDVVRAALAERLATGGRGGVPTGAVTFSVLPAFRGVSYRVICVLGLDDGVFPRAWRPAEFDLMARSPRRGDRQSREDDRNLFLDLVLAARDRIHFYFNGRSVRDNLPLPPSVLVAELLDTLAAAIAPAGADPDQLRKARARLIVEHPLQAFSLALFQEAGENGDRRRTSYDRETCDAWREALTQARAAPAPIRLADDAEADAEDCLSGPFFTAALPPPGEEWRSVALTRLRAFFRHPARTLLRERLRVRFEYQAEALPDEDPFGLDWPGRYRLWDSLLAAPEAPLELARAMRVAPPGAVGDVLLASELAEIRRLSEAIELARRSPTRPDQDFALEAEIAGEPWRLAGRLTDLHADGQLVVRSDAAFGREYLDAWLRHLALNVVPPPGVEPVTTLIARNGSVRFAPVGDAAARLAELIAFYREGLMAPLHFYPKSAWAFALHGGSLARARAVWAPSSREVAGEGDDPWWQLALRGVAEPLDARFMELASAIYGPLREALVELGQENEE